MKLSHFKNLKSTVKASGQKTNVRLLTTTAKSIGYHDSIALQ